MVMRLIFLACVLAATSLGAQAQGTVADKEASLIVAETTQNSHKQGMVRTGKILWKCSNRRCVSTSKDDLANVEVCQALAELVGPLVRFGRGAKPMPSYDLALCNVRAQIKTARVQQEHERALAARAKHNAKRTKPSVAGLPGVPSAHINKPAPTAHSDPAIPPPVPQIAEPAPGIAMDLSPGFSIRVTRLSVLGKGALQERVAAAPSPTLVDIIVEPLEIVGRGRLRHEERGTHLTVRVEKLEVIGK